ARTSIRGAIPRSSASASGSARSTSTRTASTSNAWHSSSATSAPATGCRTSRRRSSPRCGRISSTGSRPQASRASRRSASCAPTGCRRWRAPREVRDLIARTKARGFHGHNTRNTGYANALAALEAGAEVLDASIGGLGGCPYAPRATGNIATEDLVYLLDREGVETGVDLDALIRISKWLEGVLGRRLEGQVYRAGAS